MAHRKPHRAGNETFFPGLVVQGKREGGIGLGGDGNAGAEHGLDELAGAIWLLLHHPLGVVAVIRYHDPGLGA